MAARTDRFGIAVCTTHIPAEQHGLGTITAVRYAPSPRFAELASERPDAPIARQQPGLDWTQDANGDLHLGDRRLEQAILEIERGPA